MCHSFTIASYQELERTLKELSREGGFSSRFIIARSLTPVSDSMKDGSTESDGVKIGPHGEEGFSAGARQAAVKEAYPDSTHTPVKAVAYPGMFSPVILAYPASPSDRRSEFSQPRLFELHADMFGFGWPVEWKKGTVFNARLDSLLRGGGMWGDAIETQRCVVPCDSFFESHMTETSRSSRTGKPVKRRYVFSSPDGRPLLLAAVYDGEFFSIVTTDSDPEVSSIHDRMPLVLTQDEAAEWLNPELPKEELSRLVNKEVGKDDGNGAAEGYGHQRRLLIRPLDETPVQASLF